MRRGRGVGERSLGGAWVGHGRGMGESCRTVMLRHGLDPAIDVPLLGRLGVHPHVGDVGGLRDALDRAIVDPLDAVQDLGLRIVLLDRLVDGLKG